MRSCTVPGRRASHKTAMGAVAEDMPRRICVAIYDPAGGAWIDLTMKKARKIANAMLQMCDEVEGVKDA